MKNGSWKKIVTAAAVCVASVLPWFRIAEASVVQLPDYIKIIGSTDEYRQVELSGSGTRNMLVYGSGLSGSTNIINISNPQDMEIYLYGGSNDDPLADNITGNIINVRAGNDGWIAAAGSYGPQNSKVIINGQNDDLVVNVVAGHGADGNVTYNTINLYGGTLNGLVAAAETTVSAGAEKRLAHNNINIMGNGNFAHAELCGAAIVKNPGHISGDVVSATGNLDYQYIQGTDNNLNIFVQNQEVGSISGFSGINFYLPDSVGNGSRILLGRYVLSSIEQAQVNVFASGGIRLFKGDKLNLLETPFAIMDDDAVYSNYMENISAAYHYDLGLPRQNLLQLQVTGKEIRPQTSLFLAPRIPILPNRTADLLAGSGSSMAEQAAQSTGEPAGFWAVNHSNMQHDMNVAVDMDSTSLVFGVSRVLDMPNGNSLLLAPVIEYGAGSYEGYFSNHINGGGQQKYYGIAYLVKGKKFDGTYREVALRAGRLAIDFASDSFLCNGKDVRSRFDSNSLYTGGHFGIGREIAVSEREGLNYYGRLLWGITGSDTVKLSSGEIYSFKQVNSVRTRVGGYYTAKTKAEDILYTGLAWEYEFAGKARASYQDLSLPDVSARGSTVVVEAGWSKAPQGAKAGTEINLSYSMGRQRGFGINGALNWTF